MTKAQPSVGIVPGIERHSPIRNAFIRRSAHVIERLAERADEATLVEAMAAPTDFGTLARVLTDVGVIGTAVAELDPEALDLAREIERREELVRQALRNRPELAENEALVQAAVERVRAARFRPLPARQGFGFHEVYCRSSG